ncbi:LOW QUALITY PROTEIN: hypothetical protein MXB_3342, partial [Myxobolus squamalis]
TSHTVLAGESHQLRETTPELSRSGALSTTVITYMNHTTAQTLPPSSTLLQKIQRIRQSIKPRSLSKVEIPESLSRRLNGKLFLTTKQGRGVVKALQIYKGSLWLTTGLWMEFLKLFLVYYTKYTQSTLLWEHLQEAEFFHSYFIFFQTNWPPAMSCYLSQSRSMKPRFGCNQGLFLLTLNLE